MSSYESPPAYPRELVDFLNELAARNESLRNLTMILPLFNHTWVTEFAGMEEEEVNIYKATTGIVVLLSIFYGAISLIAVIGNALVIWIVATSARMHSVTNYFIANLALADIIIGLFAIPFQAALLQRWNLPYFMCAFCPFFQVLSVNVSIFTLTAIAVDRYRAIVHPLNVHPSKLRSKIAILAIWLFSTIIAIPKAMANHVILVEDDVHGGVKPYCDESKISRDVMQTFNHTLVGMQYFLPLGIISFAYVRIGWELWGSQTPGNAEDMRDAHLLKNKKRVIKMLFLVVAMFAVCWAPLQSYYILSEIFPQINKYRYINIIWFCSHWLAMSNSCCNPFIYAIYNEKFKREFRSRFRWFLRHESSHIDQSEMDRSRYQHSFRFPTDRRISSQKTEVTSIFTGTACSSVRSTLSTKAGKCSINPKGTKRLGNIASPLLGRQDTPVCVPLVPQTNFHPGICVQNEANDTEV